jgi:hypothetical protein
LGAGFGDMNANGVYQTNEIMGAGALAFNQLLYSQDASFHAAADVDGDGRITNLDLFELGDELSAGGASAAAAALYASFGPANWLMDLNVDGVIDLADVTTLVDDLVRTSRADFNLDRRVDGADYLIWQRGLVAAPGQFQTGDATLNGVVDATDLAEWQSDYGMVAPIAAAAAGTVPEPAAGALIGVAVAVAVARRRASSRHTMFT